MKIHSYQKSSSSSSSPPSKKGGEDCRDREKWKLCTYTRSFWVATVWPCMSGEADEINNGWQMFRTLNEDLVIFWGGARYQGFVVLYNMSCEPWRMLGVPFHQMQKNLTCRWWTKHFVMKDLFWFVFSLLVCLSSCWSIRENIHQIIKPKDMEFLSCIVNRCG